MFLLQCSQGNINYYFYNCNYIFIQQHWKIIFVSVDMQILIIKALKLDSSEIIIQGKIHSFNLNCYLRIQSLWLGERNKHHHDFTNHIFVLALWTITLARRFHDIKTLPYRVNMQHFKTDSLQQSMWLESQICLIFKLLCTI